METRYPIRKADGQEYANQDELMTALGKMAGGRWLIGANRMWHSGIHVNGEVAPASVLNATTPDRAVPLQCMAGGQIVAWRINRHYRTAEYTLGNPLCYSSTFVLVRSTHRPDPADESTWLAFHSLYMHLAPVSDYPIARCYQVTKQGNGIPCRRYSGNETTGQSAPVSSALPPLKAGQRVVVVRQETFLINGKPKPFGLAQRADGGDKFWISLRAEFLTEDGEAHILMPGWMKKAIAHGVYDQVVNPTVPVAIQAGDAVGFLSSNETSNNKTAPIRDTDWVAHIEVISTDENLLTFLGNPKHLRTGQQYVKLQGERPLYLKNSDGKNAAFTAMEGVATQIDGGENTAPRGHASSS